MNFWMAKLCIATYVNDGIFYKVTNIGTVYSHEVLS